MADRSIIEVVRSYLYVLDEDGIDVRFGVLYGSQANGSAGEWSDIDLVVVSPYFDRYRDHKDVERLWVLTLKTDTRIEPVACGLKEWEQDDSRAIIEIARREGLRIYPEKAAEAAVQDE